MVERCWSVTYHGRDSTTPFGSIRLIERGGGFSTSFLAKAIVLVSHEGFSHKSSETELSVFLTSFGLIMRAEWK